MKTFKDSNETSPENPLSGHRTVYFNKHGQSKFVKQPTTDLIKSTKIPKSWSKTPSVKTWRDVQAKLTQVPHISYDIDGDGVVGSTDYFVSKLFDKEGKGNLSESEKAAALDAVRKGDLNKYLFGLDEYGSLEHPRILQKRGHIVGDDYSKLLATYPKSQTSPLIKTRKELVELRKKENLKDLQQCIENTYKALPVNFHKEVRSDSRVENPSFKTKTEKLNSQKQKARLKAGLKSPSDLKDTSRQLSTNYNPAPQINTQTLLEKNRKQQMLSELQSKVNYDHKTKDQKLFERESQLISIIPEDSNFLTQKKLKQARKQADNEYNLRTFSKTTIGVHGKELPKFTSNLKSYWEHKEGYNPNPSNNSQTKLRLSHKYSKPLDKYVCSDVSNEPPPNSKEHFPLQYTERPVTQKPNNCNPFSKFKNKDLSDENTIKKPNHNYRMSTVHGYFMHTAELEGISIVPSSVEETRKLRKQETQEKEQPNVSQMQTTTSLPKHSSSSGLMSRKHLNFRSSSNAIRSSGFMNVR